MPKALWITVEIAAFIALLCIPAAIFATYSSLPAQIRSTPILLLITGSFVITLLSATPFYPDLINVPGERTPAKI